MHTSSKVVGAVVAGIFAISALACGGDSHAIAPPPPQTGVIRITVSTAGEAADIDGDGYVVIADYKFGYPIAVNSAITIKSQSIGAHRIMLGGLDPNCVVDGVNPRTITVSREDGLPPVPVAFSVNCRPPVEGDPSPWDY